MGNPLLCRLGFHKWRDYGKEFEVFWKEPAPVGVGIQGARGATRGGAIAPDSSQQPTGANFETHSKIVHEGRECTRCGMRLKRKFTTNSDGTLSSVGWEPDTEEIDKE
ncbi:MAG TPA: hypothetical protein VK487_08620 [Candidatus Bathyarchaeia archaeon]|nr:hypothetical protein [Candidatus Bathyarchaeia archaeon]